MNLSFCFVKNVLKIIIWLLSTLLHLLLCCFGFIRCFFLHHFDNMISQMLSLSLLFIHQPKKKESSLRSAFSQNNILEKFHVQMCDEYVVRWCLSIVRENEYTQQHIEWHCHFSIRFDSHHISSVVTNLHDIQFHKNQNKNEYHISCIRFRFVSHVFSLLSPSSPHHLQYFFVWEFTLKSC